MRWPHAVGAGLAAEVLAVLVAVGLVGVPLPWAWVWAVPLAAVVFLAVLLADSVEPKWDPPPEVPDAVPELQAGVLANRLARAQREHSGRFRTLVRPRLRRLALETLRQRAGTRDLSSLDDPRARAALGAELHALLTDPAARLPPPGRLAELLDRLEGP